MKVLSSLALCLWLSVGAFARSANVFSMTQTKVNNRPIIGILTEKSYSKYGDEYIESTYVQYLESAGARVVPIRGKQPPKYYRTLFKKINGALFPGGGVNITEGSYYEAGKYIYELALQANDRGDFFPIWATCLGLELLTVLRTGKWVLQNTDTENLTLPLTFAEGYETSRLFKHMPRNIQNYLQFEPVTQNNHQYSLLVEDFLAIPELNQFFQLLSTNHGPDEQEFVSLLEAYRYPIYASQWHPEKNLFLWSSNAAINHDFHAVEVTQYMANFFVNEARKSNHRFDSVDQEVKTVIEND
ncbi:gamma-glutamyl hydrolase, partial [Plakobranchus ocellatus]